MKKIGIAVLVAVAGLLAYNYVTTGELKVIPSSSVSAEQQSVKDLQERFDAAKTQYAQALRSAGVAGIDTTTDAEAARRSVKAIEQELAKLKRRLSEEKALRGADELAGSVQAFLRELR